MEKIIFKNSDGMYVPIYTNSNKTFVLATFLFDNIGSDRNNEWKKFIETDEGLNNASGYCIIATRFFDEKMNKKKIIKLNYIYHDEASYYYPGLLLLHIIQTWQQEQKNEHPFLELSIDWEQETFECTPLEHWIDPQQAEKDAYAESIINKFLARVEEWKKQNPDD